MPFKKVDAKQNLPKMEEEVLKFWEENKIFEKSLENRADCPLYTFYDGPPFATGTPHYGHLVGSTMKDIVPRFWTMKGRYVPRKWGWDCHGLPIENIVEKELGSKAKKDIEEMGVDKFNDLCRSKVLEYVSEWEKTIKRFGRWADMKNAYRTMDLPFMESVWWVFKELYDKGLIYEGYRSMHICPRCETTLSQSEVAEGYKDVKDLSAIAKFELIDEPGTFVLAWTTTPWTLIGNVALAINDKIIYCKVKSKKSKGKDEFYVLAKDRTQEILKDDEYEIMEEFSGKDLIGKAYKPLFNYYSKDEKLENRENGWKIYPADFVTIEEGTGVVHIAPAFGEDDLNLGKKEKLPFIQHVGMDGIIKKEAGEFVGKNIVEMSKDVKNIDVEVIKYLAHNNFLFSKEKYEHSYPHCWRCETPLINYATSSWFVSVEKIKEKLLETAKEINWSPKHIKEGRFGNWLESARDWSISRQRFWASVMPIWKCQGEKNINLILLSGPYAAGKTEIAKLLNKKYGYEIIDGDKIRAELFKDIKEKSEKDYKKISEVNKEIIKKIKELRKKNVVKIVVDYVDIIFDIEKYQAELNSEFSLKILLPKEDVLVDRDKNRATWHNGEELTKSDWALFNEKKSDLNKEYYIDNSNLSVEEIVSKYFLGSACGEIKVVGSVEDIREGFGNPNKFFLVRHGEAENNILGLNDSLPEMKKYKLTKAGRKQIEKTAEYLKNQKIDTIFCSHLERTKETAEIISKKINAKIIFDDRLREAGMGIVNGKPYSELKKIYSDFKQPLNTDENGIEGWKDIQERMKSFLDDFNDKHKGKNVVIVSHGDPLLMMKGVLDNLSTDEILNRRDYPEKGIAKIAYSKNIDLHKHIVDKITFKCEKCDGEMKRIPDVLDTWFDSGSMPYAQMHYPFENKDEFEKGFPAEFIAEGVDQTRCWFYYLHVISNGIKDEATFKNVVVNGIVLAEDGKKMSKRLQNYPDPIYVLEKYGADALRFYLTTSTVMQAENINFKESDVADLVRGMFRMLWNSYSFFVLYANIDGFASTKNIKPKTENLLDKWIISELNVLISDVNENMEKYELTRAARCFPGFIDNLSNWYIRRSRKRFWKSDNDTDKNDAYVTLYYILITLSKLMAPFTPFIAEEVYKNLTGEESVHLAEFPVAEKELIDEKLNEDMVSVRAIISEGLQLRAKVGIKVRQPLQAASIKYKVESEDIIDIIKEELNIKEINIDTKQEENIKLDTNITEDLKLEGQAREVVRFIQEMRKEAGYEVDNRIEIMYSPESKVFEKFSDLIAKETLANEIEKGEMSEADLKKEMEVEGNKIFIFIKKINA